MARYNGYATLSGCETYRYELGGDIGPEEPLLSAHRAARIILWLMLNPSTADAWEDDQTISTIVAFSELWGYNRLIVGNLYAYRTKHPKIMWQAQRHGVDIVGPENDSILALLVERTRRTGGDVMAAWGTNGQLDRVKRVKAIAGDLMCLKTNKDGSPVHPLYQPRLLTPMPWSMTT